MIFRDILMKLLKRYLIANSMNSDIIVAQHPIIQNDVKIILYAYTQSDFYSYYIKLHSYTYIWLSTKNISTFILNHINTNTILSLHY